MSTSSYKSWHRPNQSINAKTKQGYAIISNPEKYIGDPAQIIYRSTWEYSFIKYCDSASSVLRWSSEPIAVKYFDKVSKLVECQKYGLDPNNPTNWIQKNYYIDFWCVVDKGDGTVKKMFIEIKPSNKLIKPTPPPENASPGAQKKFNILAKEYLVNEEKFKAMKKYAESCGAEFHVFTEKTLQNIIGRFGTSSNK
jgi:hypothetical protein